MLPFITILGRQYSTYAILGLIGFFLGAFVASRRAKRHGISSHDVIFLATFSGIGLVIGGMLLFTITNISGIWRDRAFLSVDFFGTLRPYVGGMVFYGGLFGAVLGLVAGARFLRLPIPQCMSLLIPVFPLSHAVMRLGCFAAGCCYGIAFPPPLGIAFENAIGAPNGISLLPVQLLEVVLNLVIFFVLWKRTKQGGDWKVTLCIYGIMYGFARFWLEFLRGDDIRGAVFSLSTSQFISVLVLLLCIGTLMRIRSVKVKGCM